MGNIENKQKEKEFQKYQKSQEASLRMEEQRALIEQEKKEQEKIIKRRNELATMNIKQMEEFRVQKA